MRSIFTLLLLALLAGAIVTASARIADYFDPPTSPSVYYP